VTEELTPQAIRIANVCYSYDSVNNSIENINLCIADNDFIAVIGQNGCGKTTLIKTITGLLRPDRGEIFIRGKNSKELSVSEISGEIGFVMQNPDTQLFTDTVNKEAAFGLKNSGLSESAIRPRVEAALSEVGLEGQRDAFPLALSRGDRAKTIIAAVLAMGCRIIILDEPDTGQDYRGSRRIMDIAGELHKQGYTIIFITHNMSLAAEYAHRVIVMGGKKILMDGSPGEMFYRAREPEMARIIPPQIVRLSMELRKDMPLETGALNAEELGQALLRIKNEKPNR
jgi:energy-coupling factor transport system ATP-binding protein